MFFQRRILFALLGLSLVLFLAACQEKAESSMDEIFPIFGGAGNDNSTVIAKVGVLEITQRDLDFRFDELMPDAQNDYTGDEGQQLLLKEMIDETLLVLGSLEKGLENQQDVARTLVIQRRITMISAMRNIGIPEENEPTEDDYRDFFKSNRSQFMQEGTVHARHIECLTLKRAQEAYKLLENDISAYNFMKVAGDYSINKATLAREADVGWYNKTGIVGDIHNGSAFVAATFDLEKGLNRPVQVGDRWHVVEILDRHESRPMTYSEAGDLIKSSMLPGYYDIKIKEFVLNARETHGVEMYGKYAPGKGLTPETLMKRASEIIDPSTKLDYYRMIYTDFPQSDRADDALFMCALVCMDNWHDRSMAERYLVLLLEQYPESDLSEDATFLKKNLYTPSGLNPETIEDLRNN